MERLRNIYFADFPLHTNEEMTAIVNADGRAIFDFVDIDVDASFARGICAKLNGDSRVYLPEEWTAQEESIAYGGHRVLDIRGWWMLTEMYGLTGREAEWEQQEFIRWCVDVLNREPWQAQQ